MSNKTQINRPLKGLSHIKPIDSPDNKIPLSVPFIMLPRDMYLHTPKTESNPNGCPTEWWWHTGTLTAKDGRVFGFEINAAAFYPIGFTEVMLTDVKNQKHYQQSKETLIIDGIWAETNPNKEWLVNLEDVSMHAPQTDPTQNMVVKAKLVDGDTTVNFNLTLSQKGNPLYVWGDGVKTSSQKPTTKNSNYYFSLTQLQASGTIIITKGDVFETISVSGVTWMDHEWGKFSENGGNSVKWILQDMQLNNNFSISNFSLDNPVLNKKTNGNATVLDNNGNSHFVKTKMTPTKSWKKNNNGKEFFTEIKIEIHKYNAVLVVKSLMDNQVFSEGNVYEGVGSVSGTIKVGANIENTEGTAWIEQTI